MKFKLVALGALVAATAASGCGDDEAEVHRSQAPPPLTTEQLAQRAEYGVAFIKATDYRKDKKIGTGIVVSSDEQKTRILTAEHVTGPGMRVSIAGAAPVSGRLIGRGGCDADLALIEIPTPPKVTVLPVRTEPVHVGEKIVTMGFSSTQPYDNTPDQAVVKEAQVSRAAVRNISMGRDAVRTRVALQINGALNPADSGGPMLDEHGRLIGISVFKEVGPDVDNVGYGLPMSVVKPMLPQLERGDGSRFGIRMMAVSHSFPWEQFVEVRYPELNGRGVRIVAGVLRRQHLSGMLVWDSEPGRPGARIPVGSVITGVNGSDVASMTQFCDVWQGSAANSVVRTSGFRMFSAGSIFDMLDPVSSRMRVPR